MISLRAYFRYPFTVLRSRVLVSFLNARKGSCHVSKSVRFDWNCKVLLSSGAKLTIGENCKLGAYEEVYHAGMPFPTKLLIDSKVGMIEIGKNCRINGAYIHAKDNIRIGDNCVMASGVNIIDTNGHELLSLNRTVGEDVAKPIEIGSNVWIGINAVVLKGTVIGDNSVVAAGSVVKGSFPPCSLIQGNPAKVVSCLQMEEK